MENKVAILIIPTGIGASIGGFAGDASQIARKLSEHTKLIVNPNVVNAAVFSGINENMYYVEGLAICNLLKGRLSLKPSKNNKIGVIFDKSIPQNVLNVHINTINAVKTVYGVDVLGYEITKDFVGVEYLSTSKEASSGTIKNPTTLLDAGKRLVEKGATAIAAVCHFKEDEGDSTDYENGLGVDIIGGVEAMISHYLTKELRVPVAHAPAFLDMRICEKIVNPKSSAEYITPTFLPCVLLGLQNAPLLKEYDQSFITYKDISCIILPHNALGSSVVPDSIKLGLPVLAVKENSCVLNVNKYTLNLDDDIIEVGTYDDCIKFFGESYEKIIAK